GHGDSLEAAERGAEASEAVCDFVDRRPERVCERGGAERVVDVVEPRQGQLDPSCSVWKRQRERRTLEAATLDRACDDVERGPRVAATRAAVVAEVADVRCRVDVRRAATDAVLRVGGV